MVWPFAGVFLKAVPACNSYDSQSDMKMNLRAVWKKEIQK